MFPTDSIEMSLIWMYLLYFNMGLLNEMMILKQGDITGCSIQYFRGDTCDQVLLYSHLSSWPRSKNVQEIASHFLSRYYAFISYGGS